MCQHQEHFNDHLKTRREFLRTTVLGAATTWTVPLFLENTFFSLNAMAADSAVQVATGKDNTILVVLQLAGGNDGLNTIIPHAEDTYYKARTRLAVNKGDILKINDHIGFHKNLAYFNTLYQEGDLALIQGVGYPNPNRSHFRSTEIWETATDSDKFSATGWIGRYFDNACLGANPTVGISTSNELPQSFLAKKKQGVNISKVEFYRWLQGKSGDSEAEEIFREINRPDEEMTGNSVEKIGRKNRNTEESNLDFLERTALDAQMSSNKILEISRKYRSKVNYPGNPLGRSLNLVARMIAGKLPTRIYYVSHGGFDTHFNQQGTHERLLSQLNECVQAFFQDLKEQGNYDRVTIMTFSEFGRRVKENTSAGTDHGTAAPLFIMGGGVKGGMQGKHPSLTNLDQGDLKFNVDFRSVYASVLEGWLHAKSKPILGRQFKTMRLFES